MKYTFEEFFAQELEANIVEYDEWSEAVYINLNPCESIKEVSRYEVGYSNEEDVYYGFNEGKYENAVCLYEEKGFIFTEYIEENKESEYFVFTSMDEVCMYIESCRGYDSIDKQIEDFIERNGYEFEVKVNKEYNNSGRYYSFNVYYEEEFLIFDGAFTINKSIDEEIKKAVDIVTKNIYDTDVKITKIKKIKGSPSWEKYYEVEFENQDNVNVCIEYSLSNCIQGQPRNVVDVIMEAIDIEELKIELSSNT